MQCVAVCNRKIFRTEGVSSDVVHGSEKLWLLSSQTAYPIPESSRAWLRGRRQTRAGHREGKGPLRISQVSGRKRRGRGPSFDWRPRICRLLWWWLGFGRIQGGRGEERPERPPPPSPLKQFRVERRTAGPADAHIPAARTSVAQGLRFFLLFYRPVKPAGGSPTPSCFSN